MSRPTKTLIQRGRAPYGARGLKLEKSGGKWTMQGRAPYGARGLKQRVRDLVIAFVRSRSVWGAWIETF